MRSHLIAVFSRSRAAWQPRQLRSTTYPSSPSALQSPPPVGISYQPFSTESPKSDSQTSVESDGYVVLPPRVKAGERAFHAHIAQLGDQVLALPMLELAELGDYIRMKAGIPDDMPMFAAGPMPTAAAGDAAAAPVAEAPPVEEKTVFDVKLDSFDAANKIKVIKEVRAITNLGLKEAKDLVEGVPKVLKKAVKKEDADKIVATLKEVGAKVVLE